MRQAPVGTSRCEIAESDTADHNIGAANEFIELNQFIDAFLFALQQPVPFPGLFFSKLAL